MHWNKVTKRERGGSLEQFCDQLRALPEGTMLRHNQAGDLPSKDGETIDREALAKIIKASAHLRGFTYTHYRPENIRNRQAIKGANKLGFVVNLSAKSLDDADYLSGLGIAPVVVVLPSDTKENQYTPQGRLIVVCPATQREDVTCASCKLCAINSPTRPIVGFPAHGVSKRKIDKAIMLQQVKA
jgi:hypothetical protein